MNPSRSGRTTGRLSSERIAREVGRLAGLLSGFLGRSLPDADGPIVSARDFLDAHHEAFANDTPDDADWRQRPYPGEPGGEPLDRLTGSLGLSPVERDLLLLAGLPDEHEGFAEIFRTIEPWGRPRPTVALAAGLFCRDVRERFSLQQVLVTGPAVRSGAIRLEGDDPFFQRSLRLADGLWPVLKGCDAWPDRLEVAGAVGVLDGLDAWLDEPATRRALKAIRHRTVCTILVAAADEEMAAQRAAALARRADVGAVRIDLPARATRDVEMLIGLHSLARGVLPVLRLARPEGAGSAEVPPFAEYPHPVVIACRAGTAALRGSRPLVQVACERLGPAALRRMWGLVLPDFPDRASALAASYPVEPFAARRIAADLAHVAVVEGRPARPEDVASCARGRAGIAPGGGVRLVRPTAGWDHLVLPADRLGQLREAVDRLLNQATVLDDWRFLEGRPARGASACCSPARPARARPSRRR